MRFVVVLMLVACGCHAPRGGDRCSQKDPLRCDGDHALVCTSDGVWAVQRCRTGCVDPGDKPLRCEAVDDPRVGEACFDSRIDSEGYTSSPYQLRCADGHTVVGCMPPGGRWKFVKECNDGCTHGACRSEE
jgi:hypothetical protein